MSSEITEEQKAKLEKDTQEALQSLANKSKESELDKARSEAREEAKKEFELQQKLKQQEELLAKAIAEQEALKKAQAEQLEAIQKKLEDSLAQKKAPVVTDSPFSKPTNDQFLKSLSKDQIDRIEEESARAFYGDALYDALKRG
jgi:DNA repair exonuclease SbcCD ATPase subunit